MADNDNNMLIGLTGDIASGKSLIAEKLKRLGAYLIDADEIAREMVMPGLPAYQNIVKEFGEGMLNSDKTINRKALYLSVTCYCDML